MAEKVSEREIASVKLLTLEVSEDELTVLISSLNYLLSHAGNRFITHVIGAYPDEVRGIRDDLSRLLDDPAEDDLLEDNLVTDLVTDLVTEEFLPSHLMAEPA